MKNITKLLLIILVLNAHQKANAEIIGIGDNFSFWQLYAPLAALEEYYKLQKAPDAPDIIKQFCYEKLKAQGLKVDHVQIKIVADQWLASFGESYIVFGPSAAAELKIALENTIDKEAINAVNVYSVILDHEIAHLKNNDGPAKSLAVYAGASLISSALSVYVMNATRFSYLFRVDSREAAKIGPHTTWPRVFLGLTTQLLALFVCFRFARFQEKRADTYAASLAKDPDGLRSAADFLEKSDDFLMHQLSDARFDSSSPFKSSIMLALRKAYFTFYHMKKTDEDFHSWVKRQSLAYSFVKFFYDIEHPSGSSRAKAMRLAADALEA